MTNSAAGAGGFIGRSSAKYATFAGCTASGEVASLGSGSQTGGFVGAVCNPDPYNKDTADQVFTNCVASGDVVTIFGMAGGFAGVVSGPRTKFVSCTASGNVKKPSIATNQGTTYGGFVACTTASGIRFENCRALGCVCAPGMDYVGGFAGSIGDYSNKNVTNELIRCMAAGEVKGDKFVGGFCGWFTGRGTKVAECFALGDATACETGAGGFAGRVDSVMTFRDSYALGNVRSAGRYAGGFASYIEGVTGMSLTRCYAAGGLRDHCRNYYVGAFVGELRNNGYASLTDCAALVPDDTAIPLHAVGGYPSGTTTVHSCIAELSRDEFKDAANFGAFLAAVWTDDSPIWAQVDGVTQPYLAWSTPEGNLSVYAIVYGDGGGSISGGGEYEPGEEVEISAVPGYNRFFAGWSGSAQYADAKNSQTTLVLDNHRVATTQFGRYIHTADELQAIMSDLDGVVGLANSIDLSDRVWEPLVIRMNDKLPFTGKFFGMGHQITGLVATNTANSKSGYRGLFGRAVNATLDGISVSGKVCGTQLVGGLVGEAVGTLITNCAARVEVYASSDTSVNGPFGGLAGETDSSIIVGCRADGFVRGEGRVGGLIGNANCYNVIANCAARGDVRSDDDINGYAGGLIGIMAGNGGTEFTSVSNCWCSGTVWGQTERLGSFVGTGGNATSVVDCAVIEGRPGWRGFSANDIDKIKIPYRLLTAAEVAERSAGWPEPMGRDLSQAKHIATAEDLAAVWNDLSGIYILDNDINLRGANWIPLGTNSNPFVGEFYGNGHRISNFSVSSSARRDGFFGVIAGGRVSGLRLKGSVSFSDSNASDSSASDSSAGGFAGRIVYGSLVEDCSFRGDVTCNDKYVGGFAGLIAGASMVAGCCVTGRVEQAFTTSPLGCGGFVGYVNGGGGGTRIIDCYSLDSVEAEDNKYAGGFAGYIYRKYQLIDTSYCSGFVTNNENYAGAFVGYMENVASVTNSYYDSDATAMLAKGAYTKGKSEATPGVTPLTHDEMLHAENFTSFRFQPSGGAWDIDEGKSTPYLFAVGSFLSAYEQWLVENELPLETKPDDVVNGILCAFRYPFDIPPSVGPGGGPLFYLAFDANGRPYVKLPKQENDEGVIVDVLASTNLTDFAKADLSEWTGRVLMQHDDVADEWRPAAYYAAPDDYVYPPAMFFKWRISVDN